MADTAAATAPSSTDTGTTAGAEQADTGSIDSGEGDISQYLISEEELAEQDDGPVPDWAKQKDEPGEPDENEVKTETATPPAKKPEAKPTEVKKFKVKVDGKESEVDEQELVRGYQRAQAANRKFEEAAALQKSMTAFVERLQKDPISILTDQRLGLDFRKLAEEFLIEQLKYEQMAPEQRELMDAKKKIASHEQAEAARKQAEHEARVQEMSDQYADAIDQQFSASIQKFGLPRNERTIGLMADLAMRAEDAGTPWTPDALAEAVGRFLKQERDDYLKSMSPEDVRKYIGDEKVRAVQRPKNQPAAKPPVKPQERAARTPSGRKYLTEAEFDAKVRGSR